MKLIKQPFFFVGIGSVLFAIVIAVVSSLLNPSVAVLNKFEKALNKGDEKLMAKCFSPSVDKELLGLDSMVSDMDSMLSMMGMKGKITYEILAGEPVEETDEDGVVTKKVPTVMVMKVAGEVVNVTAEDMELFTESGKDYFYTGYEDLGEDDLDYDLSDFDYSDYSDYDFSDFDLDFE